MQARTFPTQELQHGEAYPVGSVWRTGRKNSVRSIINWRCGDQIITFTLMEDPNDKKVREALNVGKPTLKFRENFQHTLGVMPRVRALRDLACFGVRASHRTNRLHREQGKAPKRVIVPPFPKGT